MIKQRVDDDVIDLRNYIDIIKRRWLVIVFIALVVTVATYVYTSIQQPVYTAKTTILVRGGGGRSLSGLSGLAGLAGISFPSGGDHLSELTVLLKSKAVASKVVEDLALRKQVKGWENPKIADYKLAASVSGMLKSSKANGNLVELKVEYFDPKLTAAIANGYVQALSYYWNRLNRTEAQKKKEYIEAQLPRVERQLRTVENKLKKLTFLAPKANPSVSSLMGSVVKSQTQGIQVSRLNTELEIQSSVYTMLRKEYETVKLEESKKIMPFSVVDRATVPERPSKPKMKFNILVGIALGLFSGMSVAFFQDYWEGSKGV